MNKLSASLAALILAAPALSLAANDFNSLQALNQSQFKTLAENLGAVTSYKGVAPAEPLGVTGFDLGVEITATEIDKDLFDLASSGGWDLSTIPVPKLHAHKGLPFNLDVGAFLATAPDTDFRLFGAELRYAFLEGGVTTPAVAGRLTYSTMTGVDELELSNTGVELSISKGFLMLTPYAGIGKVFTTAKAVDVNTLDEESVTLDKVFAGVNINLGANLDLEVDKTGDYATYSAKLGFRF
ncbi:MAG: hypothetical protein ACWA5X_01910 [bacterium]